MKNVWRQRNLNMYEIEKTRAFGIWGPLFPFIKFEHFQRQTTEDREKLPEAHIYTLQTAVLSLIYL